MEPEKEGGGKGQFNTFPQYIFETEQESLLSLSYLKNLRYVHCTQVPRYIIVGVILSQ